jgi:hypothetical protein
MLVEHRFPSDPHHGHLRCATLRRPPAAGIGAEPYSGP